MSGRPSNYNRQEYSRAYSAIVGTLGAVQHSVPRDALAKIYALMRMSFMLGHLHTHLEQEEFSDETDR